MGSGDGNWGHVIIWEFRVRPGLRQRFEFAYGPEGAWAELFRRSQGYMGTELNRDANDDRRYVTLDFWVSRQEYESFRREHAAEYKAMDQDFAEMTESEIEIGRFERIRG